MSKYLKVKLFIFFIISSIELNIINARNEFQDQFVEQQFSFFNIMKYGAKGDGKTDDTDSIQQTIDTCHQNGGGTVFIPKGTFMIGTLVLKDNVTLYLSAGGILLGSSNLEDYRPLNHYSTQMPSFMGDTLQRDLNTLHLIYAEKGKNMSIIGQGTISGQGTAFWNKDYVPLDRPGPMIQFEACENVNIENVTLQNAPFWTLHLLGCDNVKIHNITIKNHRYSPNTDGIDINSSANVIISNCLIDTGDDAICLKARLTEKSCENITVSNCILYTNHSGIKLGTHSLGNIRHCLFHNCIIQSSYLGIGLYMKDGGVFEDIKFVDLSVNSNAKGNEYRQVFPIIIDLELRSRGAERGIIQNISFSNIDLTTRGRCLISGLKNQSIEGLTFDNIRMRVPVCDGFNHSSKPRGILKTLNDSPEADYSSIPAHFILSHVKNIVFRNFQVEVMEPDMRNERFALWGIKLSGVTINGFQEKTQIRERQLPMFSFNDCKNLFITGCQAPQSTRAFLHLEGSDTQNINVIGNDLHFMQIPFLLSREVTPTALFETANRLP